MAHPSRARIVDSADVSSEAAIGDGTVIWHMAQVREGAVVGRNCVIGRSVYVDSGVVIGDNCKIQNGALIYGPAHLGEGVFVGPSAVLTNDTHPRAISPDGSPKRSGDWDAVSVNIRQGASIGAGAICVAPVEVGAWAMVAAGAVVVAGVPDFALVGGVPAVQIGWVGKAGRRLMREVNKDEWVCPDTGERYVEASGVLSQVGP